MPSHVTRVPAPGFRRAMLATVLLCHAGVAGDAYHEIQSESPAPIPVSIVVPAGLDVAYEIQGTGAGSVAPAMSRRP